MGAYDSGNPRRGGDSPYDLNPSVNDVDRVNDRLSGLAVSESSDNSSIYQVMRAVEDAENTIKQQMEENQQLKEQLLRQTRELENYKLVSRSRRPSTNATRDAHAVGFYKAPVSNIPEGNESEGIRWTENKSSMNPEGTVVYHQNGTPEIDNAPLRTGSVNQQYPESAKVNGSLKLFPGVQTGIDSAGVSQLSTPSSRSLSPTRHRKEGEYDARFNGQGMIRASETVSNNLWKQDLAIKVRERDEEIVMLRKHLADYSIKEAQIRNEKYILEKRTAYMRMAFDQQQQDLVDAASKALSYRQDIIEENIRLTYALQAAQQDRSTFISSLVPLLAEYNLQPPVHDAQSIVTNLKVLFRHLQEKLIFTEDKLKESQYQLAPWPAESSNNTNFPPQSPYSLNAAVANSNKSLEIVPQSTYSHTQSPISSPSNAQTKPGLEAVGNQNHNPSPSGFAARNPDHDAMERIPPSLSRNTMAHDASARTVSRDASAQVTQDDSHVPRFDAEFKDQNPSFKDLVRGNETDEPEPTGLQHGREGHVHWGSGNSPYLPSGLDDPNSSYPYLPPVLEEPSSSFSEAAEDDPLPGIEGLQISGEGYPGRELQATGYSINGTTSCNFEWVRCLEDGSVNYIEGAKQPKYLVTADDVDCYLALEVHPLDDRKRKGELVKVYANDHQKITCDPEMQEQIEKYFSIGHMSYDVLLSAKFLDIWERAVLAIKREGYSIKCIGPRGVVIAEKFLPSTFITIPYGHTTEFAIQSSNADEYLLRANDSSWSRDTIVLTMRLFKKMAVEKRRGRKKGLFFKS